LEEFTEIVSHNLRSPIGNVLSLLELLSKSTDEKERDELNELITRSGKNILTSLDELNEVLKIKQDQQIEKQELSFETVYQRVRNMLHSKAVETGAEFHSDFQVGTIFYPNIYLESILLNLLSNSLKYSDSRRKPQIKVKTYTENENLILSVEDNGLGIDLKRYGHQLFKLRKTFHNHPEGRGVGLFLVKNQIEALGGTISASSKKNEGTTFTIDFGKQN
jgi:signal transduction histidine kinase